MSQTSTLAVAVECDKCGHYHRYPAGQIGVLKCDDCGDEVGPIAENWTLEDGCPVCQCRHLYRQKDFNQLVGLVVIIVGAILAVAISYWFLLIFSLIDLLLFKLVKEVAVCHRCRLEIRGVSGVENVPLFDHHTADIYQPIDPKSDPS